MTWYVYDGGFEGLLTALHEASAAPDPEDRVLSEEEFGGDLFVSPIEVPADSEKAARFAARVEERIGPDALRRVKLTFLSEAPEAGTLAHRYLTLGFAEGPRTDAFHHDPRVRAVHGLARRVAREAHRLKGLLRFSRLESGLWCAPVEPDHNVIGLLAPHFAARLADQEWLIHDRRRGLAALYDGGGWVLVPCESLPGENLAAEEPGCRRLWRDYFDKLAVPERRNPRLQRQFMPKKYWPCLTEMQG